MCVCESAYSGLAYPSSMISALSVEVDVRVFMCDERVVMRPNAI